jgi:hypothetical protein
MHLGRKVGIHIRSFSKILVNTIHTTSIVGISLWYLIQIFLNLNSILLTKFYLTRSFKLRSGSYNLILVLDCSVLGWYHSIQGILRCVSRIKLRIVRLTWMIIVLVSHNVFWKNLDIASEFESLLLIFQGSLIWNLSWLKLSITSMSCIKSIKCRPGINSNGSTQICNCDILRLHLR